MPMLIPESLLQKEKDHVEGFAPEVAWVTHGGLAGAAGASCASARPLRHCSVISMQMISTPIRDLPTCVQPVVLPLCAGKKTTRPFLRSREFLWQEGHTAHATAEEAEAAHDPDAE